MANWKYKCDPYLCLGLKLALGVRSRPELGVIHIYFELHEREFYMKGESPPETGLTGKSLPILWRTSGSRSLVYLFKADLSLPPLLLKYSFKLFVFISYLPIWEWGLNPVDTG
jgi:hypothetical protein